ncbi:MAG: hypothetical protein ACRDM7_01475 [Thermoleophilaceae bacterium]
MAEAAFTLAAVRAAGPCRLSEGERASAAAAATHIGRRLVKIHDARERAAFTVGWADGYEPAADSDVVEVWRLSPVPLITLAACLALCWRDRDADPYPGEPTTGEEVVDTVAGIGADRRWALGALRNDLRLARLVELRRGEVTLGPAVAAWSATQLSTLRKFSTALPGPAPSGSDTP